MQSLTKGPALAEAADLLSSQLQAQLQRLAGLLVRCCEIDSRFQGRLRQLGFDAKQRKALAELTPGAAARVLARQASPAAFLEQVEYNGRRLAKLNVEPGAVLAALQEYDEMLEKKLRRLTPAEAANFQWAREQLSFSVLLTLNNAYYQVREAETQAFFLLSEAELRSGTQRELLSRSLEILTRFCQAEAGRIFLLDRQKGRWALMAAVGGGEAAPESGRAMLRELSRPHYITRGSEPERLLLEPGWRGAFASCWSVPFFSGRRLAGVLQFGFGKPYEWLPRELQLLTAAAERALIASEKARLMAELAEREERIRTLASHMQQVEEAERRRISRELHDETGQLLLCLRLELEKLEYAVPAGRADLQERLSGARGWVEQTIVEIRRVLSDLSPAVLEQLGLAAAVRQLVTRFRQFHAVRVRLQIGRLGPVSKEAATVLYRLVQESLNNIGRHSSASHVIISLTSADEVLRLRVRDDGVGFQVDEALAQRASFGLAGMRERVTLLGGRCEIHSRPGHGTAISIALPHAARERPAGEAIRPSAAIQAGHYAQNSIARDR